MSATRLLESSGALRDLEFSVLAEAQVVIAAGVSSTTPPSPALGCSLALFSSCPSLWLAGGNGILLVASPRGLSLVTSSAQEREDFESFRWDPVAVRATAVFQFYLPYVLPRDGDWDGVRLPFTLQARVQSDHPSGESPA